VTQDLPSLSDEAPPMAAALGRDGFVFIDAPDMRAMLPSDATAGFDAFAQSWDRLGDDRFMADGGRYRRRRHATFAVGPDGIVRQPHQPHYQSRDHNMLNGGIERWFEPVEPDMALGATLRGVIGFADRTFSSLSGGQRHRWHVEVHQFRIEAGTGTLGLPTPEGLHRDGVDWVLVMLMARRNVHEGVTRIHGSDRTEIGAFCLTQPFDTVLVDDNRIYHAVTPIIPVDPEAPACRDVLVITFKAINR